MITNTTFLRSPPSPTSLLALFVPRRGSKNEERARLMDGGRTPSFNDDEDLRMFESLDITSRLAAGPSKSVVRLL